jgi:AraC-like DNA-binding protein
MIIDQKPIPALASVGYYVSLLGGASAPYLVSSESMLFEQITGGAVYGPDDRTLYGPGWIFAHGPGDHSVFRSEPNGYYECMAVNFDLTRTGHADIWPRCFEWNDTERAETFAHEMLYAFHHTNVERKIIGNLIWSQFRFLLDAFLQPEGRHEIPPRLSEVLSYIDRHLEAPLGVDMLAEHVGLSASHLHARFKEYLKTTPHQYIILRRLQKARHRLATTLDPIKAVAADVGYANAESFCRAFKAHFNTTAAAYRRRFMIYTSVRRRTSDSRHN